MIAKPIDVCHSSNQSNRIKHRYLDTALESCIYIYIVGLINAVDIRKEDRCYLSSLGCLGKLNVVVKTVFVAGHGGWVFLLADSHVCACCSVVDDIHRSISPLRN